VLTLEDEVSEPSSSTSAGPWLRGSNGRLCDDYDLAIVDLDGTVYVGRDAVPGAAQVLSDLRATAMRVAFVTNNASRTPAQVARTLERMGVEAGAEDVVTSAQAAAATLRTMVAPGSAVLVVGGRGIQEALESQGLKPVDSVDDDPVAVVQGWTPELDWRMLAEGAYALARGLPWVATNTDVTVPTGRGIAPGNGSFVALLGRVAGRTPDVVAGKPGVALLEQTARRYRSATPLVVGDRLDTDIAGAVAAGMDSLLVLTGVTAAADLLAAGAGERPTYVGADISALLSAHPEARRQGGTFEAGDASVTVERSDSAAVVNAHADAAHAAAETLDLLRAAAAAEWTLTDSGSCVRLGDALQALLAPSSP
jgi:glycerol-1-phosphatase